MTATLTDKGEKELLDRLSAPYGEFDEPTLAELIGFGIDDDEERKVRTYDLFFHQPISLQEHVLHRDTFDILQENSRYRSTREIDAKLQELMHDSTEPEEGVAIDILRWVLNENVDWVLDQHINGEEE